MQKILIVDDNDANLYYLQILLQSAGYEVVTTLNGAEALNSAMANPPDLVISDLLMPVMDGFTLLRQWKADQKLDQIPFVVYTATYTDAKDERFALDLGADAFIVKPTEPVPFLEQIHEVLAKAQRGDLSPVNAPEGGEAGLLQKYNDVLIHKLEAKAIQLEEANRILSAREAHLAAIIETSPNCITSIASNGIVLSMNEAGLRMLEADSTETILGQCIYPMIVPEYLDAYRNLVERVCRGESGMIECEMKGLLGSRRWLEMHAAPLRNSENNRIELLGIAQDITGRKWAEAARAAERKKLDVALASMTDAVFITDSEGIFIHINDAFAVFHRYKSKEDCPRAFSHYYEIFDLFSTEGNSIPFSAWPVTSALRGESGINVEYNIRHKGTGDSWVGSYSFSPLRDAHGEVIGSVVVARDITERKQLEEQYHQAQKMETIGQLTGGIAHDFNNILTVILGCSEFIGEEVNENPRLSKMATMILEAARRGAELTHHMLAFARRQALQPKPVNISQLLLNMQILLRRTLSADIELAISPCGADCEAIVDAAQLENALLNLALNSRDAMPNGGKLTISADTITLDTSYAEMNYDVTPGQYIQILVSDTGSGISPENLKHVFDPFFTTKDVGKGTGLGLSMVYGFAKQSKGHIRIDSALGRGTTIKLYLPKCEHASKTSNPFPDTAADTRGSEVILLVEDDKNLRDFVIPLLLELGYQVLEASNGQDALGIIKKASKIDLLFTDIVMPGGLNGLQLGEEAKKIQPELKLLYCSGYAQNADLGETLKDKKIHFLGKPYTLRELAKKIRSVFAESTSLQEGRDANA